MQSAQWLVQMSAHSGQSLAWRPGRPVAQRWNAERPHFQKRRGWGHCLLWPILSSGSLGHCDTLQLWFTASTPLKECSPRCRVACASWSCAHPPEGEGQRSKKSPKDPGGLQEDRAAPEHPEATCSRPGSFMGGRGQSFGSSGLLASHPWAAGTHPQPCSAGAVSALLTKEGGCLCISPASVTQVSVSPRVAQSLSFIARLCSKREAWPLGDR